MDLRLCVRQFDVQIAHHLLKELMNKLGSLPYMCTPHRASKYRRDLQDENYRLLLFFVIGVAVCSNVSSTNRCWLLANIDTYRVVQFSFVSVYIRWHMYYIPNVFVLVMFLWLNCSLRLRGRVQRATYSFLLFSFRRLWLLFSSVGYDSLVMCKLWVAFVAWVHSCIAVWTRTRICCTTVFLFSPCCRR